MNRKNLNVKFVELNLGKNPEDREIFEYITCGLSTCAIFLPENIEHVNEKNLFYHKRIYEKLKEKYGESTFIAYVSYDNEKLNMLTKIEEISHLMLWLEDPNYFIRDYVEEHFIVGFGDYEGLRDIIKKVYFETKV
jgi:hypothetical protein